MSDVVKQDELEKDEDREGMFAVSQNFGILLKHYRVKVKDMTLRELAEASQLSESYINRLERAERSSPSVPTVLRLCSALDIPYDVLMATTFQPSEGKTQTTVSDVLIQNNFVINERALSRNEKAVLIRMIEHIVECEWSINKVRELYELSEMIDEFKEAM